MKIEVVQGSVLNQPTEAIVNAANTSMRGGGGVDGAIHRAAGPDLLQELIRVAPHGAKTSHVVVTQGHRLPHRWVLHVARPYWSGGERGEADLLRACYHNALLKAEEIGASSIAFPSISRESTAFRWSLPPRSPSAPHATTIRRPSRRSSSPCLAKGSIGYFRAL